MNAPQHSDRSGSRIGDLQLDLRQHRVTRGEETISLGKLTFELLHVLAESAPNLVTHDELAEQVWNGRPVSPETIAQRVKLLRDGLSDDAKHPRYVEVVHGLGYRLIPEPQALDGETPSSRQWRLPWLVAASILLGLVVILGIYFSISETRKTTASVEPRSVAALPFENLSPDPDHVYFAASMHNDLLAKLATISTLKVVSRTSVMGYQGTTKNLRVIGDELGVDAILEGSVQRVGDAVRINVQLIDAETDKHLWAQLYDRELTPQNIFRIQSEMATAVAESLQATLSPEDVSRLNDVPTHNMRAYDFYLRGNSYIRRNNRRRFLPLATQMYDKAVQEDPGFVLGWAMLSRAHSVMYLYAVDRSDGRLRRARDAVERAFSLQPGAPEAHLAMGYYHFIGSRDNENALKDFAIAGQSMPGDMELFRARGLIYRRMGEWQQALTNLEQAIDLDPRNPELLYQAGLTYLNLRKYVEAERYFDLALEVAPDDRANHFAKVQMPLFRDGDVTRLDAAAENPPIGLDSVVPGLMWKVAIYQRDYDKALDHLNGWGAKISAKQAFYIPKSSYYGVTYQLASEPELAKREFQSARAQLETAINKDSEDVRLYVSLGEAMAGLGEPQGAVALARQAMEGMPTSKDAMIGPYYQVDSVVRVLVPAGDYDAAIDVLDAYLSAPGHWSIEGLLPDPRLDPIRDDPRFHALVEKHRRR